MGQSEAPASASFVAARMDLIERYTSSWISVWVINPGTAECPYMADVGARLKPWLPRWKQFLGSPQ